MPIAEHLVFKGGTSLSKAWKLINRFSEDIDLAIDKEFFEGFEGDISKSKITKLRKEASAYTTGTFFKELEQSFKTKEYNGLNFVVIEAKESDQDPRILEIYYPNVITQESGYILPRVQLEISCRSLKEPFSDRTFGALVDEEYSDKDFAKPLFVVPTVNPERTFLEKLFLLHEKLHKPDDSFRLDRLSRHLYDIYLLTESVAKKAIADKELYETIVAHRHKFVRVGGVDYNQHHPTTLNPIPSHDLIEDWKEDYNKMKEDMIYGDTKPSFNELINNLNDLRNQLQSVEWNFELNFPPLNHQ